MIPAGKVTSGLSYSTAARTGLIREVVAVAHHLRTLLALAAHHLRTPLGEEAHHFQTLLEEAAADQKVVLAAAGSPMGPAAHRLPDRRKPRCCSQRRSPERIPLLHCTTTRTGRAEDRPAVVSSSSPKRQQVRWSGHPTQFVSTRCQHSSQHWSGEHRRTPGRFLPPRHQEQQKEHRRNQGRRRCRPPR